MLKSFIPAAVATAFLITAPAHAESYKRIKSESDYLAAFSGKTLVDDKGNSYKITPGKITGKVGKQTFKGAWQWHQGYWCRNGRLGQKEIGTDCQIIKVNGSGTAGQYIRNKGKGATVAFTVK